MCPRSVESIDYFLMKGGDVMQNIRTRRAKCSAAFTLVELLVVIAIIGVLIALLLPAVQAAREAARRMTCTNKLKQFGIGMHNYHDSHGTFPSGIAVDGGSKCPNQSGGMAGARATWAVQILPYIEQTPLWDKFVQTETFTMSYDNVGSSTNHALATQPNPAFWCPSDPFAKGSATNYMVCAGGGPPFTGGERVQKDFCAATEFGGFLLYYNGVFYVNSGTRMADITDGTSNCYLMSETKYMYSRDCPNPNKAGCWACGAYLGAAWRYYVNLIAAVEPINKAPYAAGPPNCNEGNVGRTFGSMHPGGCNALFGDGSVHFMSETMDLNTHRSLGVRDDGKPMGGVL
jgi:prepilin-type N-terminal cleavage/methylation domain-containing protein/prepilin-type processing-associated H-X9-DG protein